MRIEFYHTSTDSSKLQWDLTHANYSAITEQKSRAYTVVAGEIFCSEGGFFLEPSRVSRRSFPTLPATHETVLTWLIRSGFFSPLWTAKLLLGNESVLYAACQAQPNRFPTNLRGLLLNRTHSDVEDYLETLKASNAGERFQAMKREQSLEIATYQNKMVPRLVDSE